MKLKLSILSIGFIMIFILGIISSCFDQDKAFKILSLNWSTNKGSVYDSPIYNSNDNYHIINPKPIDNDTIEYNNFSISFSINNTILAHQSNKYHFNFIQTANAVPKPEAYILDKLDSIVISTNKQFDESHSIGSNLSDLFEIARFRNFNSFIIIRYNLSLVDFNKSTSNRWDFDEGFVLLLKKMPSYTSDYQFTVKVYQHGGDINYFEYTTPKIFIKNY